MSGPDMLEALIKGAGQFILMGAFLCLFIYGMFSLAEWVDSNNDE